MRTYRGRNGEEVIEISSDEDDTGRVVQSRPIMLQGRTKRLVRRLEGAIEDLKREKDELVLDKERLLAHLMTPLSDDNPGMGIMAESRGMMTCPMCFGTMWTPRILSCGHAFCRKCLIQWFDTVTTSYLVENPMFELRPPHVQEWIAVLNHPHTDVLEGLVAKAELTSWIERAPGPRYECPACRTAAKCAPKDCFALTSIIRNLMENPEEQELSADQESATWNRFFITIPVFPRGAV